MPGYSGTPLPKKLGLKDNFRVVLVRIPADVQKELRPALTRCQVIKDSALKDSIGALDFAMVFTKSQAKLKLEFPRLAQHLLPAGTLWVSWPKKTSGVPSDLTENAVRDIGLAAGLVDVKVCAVTHIWSGLKFVRRLKDR
jgi:hypothetical protein